MFFQSCVFHAAISFAHKGQKKKNELANLHCLQIDFWKITTEVNKISLRKTTETVAERAVGWRGVWKCAHQKCITLSSGLTLSN